MSPMTEILPTRLCLIRHGETDWNGEKRIQGHIDIDLNATGEAQARALQAGLSAHRFAAAYSSDLKRAWHTATIATLGMDIAVTPEPTFRERHFGVFQGITSVEACERYPEAHRHHKARTPDYAYESGESLVDFSVRILAAMDGLTTRHAGQNVLIFTHGGVLDVVNRAATGRALNLPRDFILPNAALNWVERDDKGWRLISWADCGHLNRALDEVLD